MDRVIHLSFTGGISYWILNIWLSLKCCSFTGFCFYCVCIECLCSYGMLLLTWSWIKTSNLISLWNWFTFLLMLCVQREIILYHSTSWTIKYLIFSLDIQCSSEMNRINEVKNWVLCCPLNWSKYWPCLIYKCIWSRICSCFAGSKWIWAREQRWESFSVFGCLFGSVCALFGWRVTLIHWGMLLINACWRSALVLECSVNIYSMIPRVPASVCSSH